MTHVAADAFVRPPKRSSTEFDDSIAKTVVCLTGDGCNREGHDFSRAENAAYLSSALAAEASFSVHNDAPSGAKARQFTALSGTAEAVPFPSAPAVRISAGQKLYDEPSETDRYQMIRTYFQMLIEEELPDAAGKMKQFASWFTHGVPGGASLRKAIYESKSAPEILTRVEAFFEARIAVASE